MIHGIDLSSKKIAIASYDDGNLLFREIIAPKKLDWLARFYWLHDGFGQYVQEHFNKNDVVYIEDIPYVQNIRTLTTLVHMVAACRLVLSSQNIEHIFISNSTWKKGAGVKTGRMKKDAVKRNIRDRCKELFDLDESIGQDLMDASLIAYYGYLEEEDG